MVSLGSICLLTGWARMAAAIYRQQKVLSHFPVCCWIDWLLMTKNCLIESGTPCIFRVICGYIIFVNSLW
jgi:hypothetical protein